MSQTKLKEIEVVIANIEKIADCSLEETQLLEQTARLRELLLSEDQMNFNESVNTLTNQ